MKILHQENSKIHIQNRSTLDFPQHLHDVLELVFLRQGTATAICGSRRYGLAAGDVFVSFPNQVHGYEDSRQVMCDVVIIPTSFLNPWRSQLLQKLPAEPVLKCGSWEHTGIPALLDMLRPEEKTLSGPIKQGYSLVITGKLLPLLCLSERDADAGNTLQVLMEYLGEHYREPVSRSDLARAVGYNESYISHVFSQQLGTTLKSYITSLRLRDARELVADTDMTVSQISLLLGFGSIRSFNRAFAREFGCNPTDYRFHSNLIDK